MKDVQEITRAASGLLQYILVRWLDNMSYWIKVKQFSLQPEMVQSLIKGRVSPKLGEVTMVLYAIGGFV